MAPTYTEEDIANALSEQLNDDVPLRSVAAKYGIPAQTLSDRKKGSRPRNLSKESQQRLTSDQEKRVVDWILQQERLGYAPSHQALRTVVERLLKEKGDTNPLGQKWIKAFKKRHPSIHSKKGTRQESVRFEAFTPKAVN